MVGMCLDFWMMCGVVPPCDHFAVSRLEMKAILQPFEFWFRDNVFCNVKFKTAYQRELPSNVAFLLRNLIEGNVRMDHMRRGKDRLLHTGIIGAGFHTDAPERIS